MNILGINGSPRAKGNTEILLDAMLAGAQEAGAIRAALPHDRRMACRRQLHPQTMPGQ